MKLIKRYLGCILGMVTMLLATSCVDQVNKDITYRLENTLDMPVRVQFYLTSQTMGPTLIIEEFGEGIGLLVERTIKNVNFNDEDDPFTAFGADSLVITFDGIAKQSHVSTSQPFPSERSVFLISSYDNGTYEIRQSNLDNAVPCDGPCD